MIDDLLSRRTSFNLLPFVHVLEELRGGGLGDGIAEVRADIRGTVGTILFAKVLEDGSSALLWCELDFGLCFFLDRRHLDLALGIGDGDLCVEGSEISRRVVLRISLWVGAMHLPRMLQSLQHAGALTPT